VGPLTTA
jgi:hypothetical protein